MQWEEEFGHLADEHEDLVNTFSDKRSFEEYLDDQIRQNKCTPYPSINYLESWFLTQWKMLRSTADNGMGPARIPITAMYQWLKFNKVAEDCKDAYLQTILTLDNLWFAKEAKKEK